MKTIRKHKVAVERTLVLKVRSTSDKETTHETQGLAFDPKIDYDTVLVAFRKDFLERLEKVQPSPKKSLDGYVELNTLGSGSFGKVKLVKEKSTQNYFAVKIMEKDQIVRLKQLPHVYSEKQILECVRFPFMIYLEFSCKDNDFVYLGLPFVVGGDLFHYHSLVRRFNEKQSRFYLAQVLLALEYLHNADVLFRDLKTENIMIDSQGFIKLADFGFAKLCTGRTLSFCGTPEYLAPEIIEAKPYGFSADLWSYGILVYELAYGHTPFFKYSADVMKMYKKICIGKFTMPESFSIPLQNLVQNLLQVDMTKRIGLMKDGLNEIKTHEWFKTVNWYALLNRQVYPPYIPAANAMQDLVHFDKFQVDVKKFIPSRTNKHEDLFADW